MKQLWNKFKTNFKENPKCIITSFSIGVLLVLIVMLCNL